MRGRRWRGIAVASLAAALLALPAAATGVGETNPDRAIVIYAGGEDVQPVASFPKVSCKVTGSGGAKKFVAKAKNDGWTLEVHANDFSGFHEYLIEYGIKRTNFILTPPGNNGHYANFYFPGEEPPPAGGALTFPGGRKTMGLGFIDAFNVRADDPGVLIAGKARCGYPKKKK